MANKANAADVKTRLICSVRSKNRDMEMVTRELMVVKVDHQLHAQSAEDTRFKTLGRSRGEELQASVRLHR